MRFQDMDIAVVEALRVEGVLFDMDGLLVDTESLAMQGLEQAAAEMGIPAPESFRHAMIGVPADHCRILVQERFGPGFPAEDYLAAASRHMNAMIEAGALRLKPGVGCLLSHLEARGCRRRSRHPQAGSRRNDISAAPASWTGSMQS